jgi:uncharacterized LabA/DUF88 family protein/cold shock CspA family protein
MLKAGVYVDADNIMMNGGFGMRYRRVRELVEAQGCVVLRANAYMAIDEEREETDSETRKRRQTARDFVRREGFNLALKPVRKFSNSEGGTVTKSNSDLEMAVDVLTQSENLDYILLCTGDGDFIKLVKALQNRGRRVDLLAFSNVSSDLRKEVDYYFNGYLMPGILPTQKDDPKVTTGFLHRVDSAKGFGFITTFTGLKPTDYRDDIFVHITDIKDASGITISNTYLENLRQRQAVLEFDIETNSKGQFVAKRVTELKFE